MATTSSPYLTTTLFLFSLFFPTILASKQPHKVVEEDIHELLPKYGLPRGLVPGNVESYSFTPPSSPSSTDGSFSLILSSPCYVHFSDHLVYYSTHISGKVGYGVVQDASGIQAKKLFLWVSVTGIKVGQGDDLGMVEFFVGSLSEKLPAMEFQDVPACGTKSNFGLKGFSGLDGFYI